MFLTILLTLSGLDAWYLLLRRYYIFTVISINILVNSGIRKLDSIGMGLGIKSYASRPREGRRNELNKFRRAVNMERAINYSKGSNTGAELNRSKTVSNMRGVDEAQNGV